MLGALGEPPAQSWLQLPPCEGAEQAAGSRQHVGGRSGTRLQGGRRPNPTRACSTMPTGMLMSRTGQAKTHQSFRHCIVSAADCPLSLLGVFKRLGLFCRSQFDEILVVNSTTEEPWFWRAAAHDKTTSPSMTGPELTISVVQGFWRAETARANLRQASLLVAPCWEA